MVELALIQLVCVCVVGICVAIGWGWKSILVISAPNNALTQWLGRPYRLLRPGLYLLAWPLEKLHIHRWTRTDELAGGRTRHNVYEGYAISKAEQKFDPPPYSVVSKNHVLVKINIVVFYKITSSAKACYAIQDLYASMETLLETAIVEKAAVMTLDDADNGKNKLQSHVQAVFERKQDEWGIQITGLDVQSITPPAALVTATTASVVRARAGQAEFQQQERLHTGELRRIERDRIAEASRIAAESANREAEHEAQAAHELAQATHQAHLAEIENVKLVDGARAKAAALKLDQEARAYGKRVDAKALTDTGLSDDTLRQFVHWNGIAQAVSSGSVKFLPQSALNLLDGMTLFHDMSREART